MSESQSLRPRFFNGKLITPADFELEQQYFRDKLKRHNRRLHGFGIVSGLKVTIKSGQIVVEPGLALDCEGNELVVEVVQSIVAPLIGACHTTYLSVRFIEAGGGFVSSGAGEEPSTITESVEFAFETENSNRGHRHLRARWLACGKPHALTIAKLRHGPQSWHVDRGYRPPLMK
jgi:hypothetical protein